MIDDVQTKVTDYDGGSRTLWVQDPRAHYFGSRPETAVAYLELSQRQDTTYGPAAYLTREQAKAVVAKLQELIADADIIEPEGIGYVVDSDGDRWDRQDDGLYGIGVDWIAPISFETLVQRHGPVTPYRETVTVEALPAVSA